MATVILLAVVFIPMLWGWRFAYTSSSQGYWSMASEDGVPPCSFFYIARAEQYQTGDVVSFWYYDDPSDPVKSAIKRIVAVKTDGTLVCRGDNAINSDREAFVVPCDMTRGKIVAGPVSLLPTASWRWLSMNWTLQAEEMAERERNIFSLRHILQAVFPGGRWRMWLFANLPPSQIQTRGDWTYASMGQRSVLFNLAGEARWTRGTFLRWNAGGVELITPSPHRVLLDWRGKVHPLVVPAKGLGFTPGSGSVVGFDGDVDVSVGQKMGFRGREYVVVGVRRVADSTVADGMTTLVTLSGSYLNPPPEMGEPVTVR